MARKKFFSWRNNPNVDAGVLARADAGKKSHLTFPRKP
jgi:hypothetical protein